MKGVFNLCCLILLNSFLVGQDDWDFENTSNPEFFIDTRAVNGHTTEVLDKNELDLRITHRFGEIVIWISPGEALLSKVTFESTAKKEYIVHLKKENLLRIYGL